MRFCIVVMSLAFIILFPFAYESKGADFLNAADTTLLSDVGDQPTEQTIHPEKSKKSSVGRLISNFIDRQRVDPYRWKSEREQNENMRAYLDRFNGKIINDIYIFPKNIADTVSKIWADKALNSLHVVTKENVIRRDLLFKPGDIFDADELMRNNHLIRTRSYISDIYTSVVPAAADTNMVNIYITTYDTWTISADAAFDGDGEAYVKLYDDNFIGYGNSLGLTTYFDWKEWNYGGSQAEYKMPNMFGTFFTGRFVLGKGFDHFDYGFETNKNFIMPNDHAGGGSFMYTQEPVYLKDEDSTVNVTYNNFDIWAGRSWRLNSKANIYTTLRFTGANYKNRPVVTPTLNPTFHNHNMLLGSIGFYRENFQLRNLIYGYGAGEYIPYGYRVGFTAGYSWEEFGNRWYLGGEFNAGYFTDIGHIAWRFGMGSYLNEDDNKFYRTTLAAGVNYFSNLMGRGRYKVRQFVDLYAVRGWNRLDGYHEYVKLNRRSELRGLREDVFGVNKLTLNSETVVFTPWVLYQFKIALVGYMDMGMIGDNGNFFKNQFYTTLGVGLRIKSDSFVFQTINIRMGIALNKNGFMRSDYFSIYNGTRHTPMRFIPGKASVVEYR